MRDIRRTLITSLLAVLIVGALAFQVEARKLPAGTYIKSAKIEIVDGGGNMDRLQNAIYMLDSLFLYYGPHAEGLYWMHQIYYDILEKTPDLTAKREPLKKMVAYRDSLHMCCADPKNKNRKNCETYISDVDSAAVFYWRTYYNAAVEQVKEVRELTESINNETDSTARAYFVERRLAQLDSTKANMLLSIMIDSTDPRSYIGLATAYKESGEYDSSMAWLNMALARASEDSKPTIWMEAAYNRIQANKYCEAVPYFNDYCNAMLADTAHMADQENVSAIVGTMTNLAICLNNCKLFDSAYTVNQKILTIEPLNVDALQNSGRFHSQMAREANDSATAYRDAGNAANEAKWRGVRQQQFMEARKFLQQVFEVQTGQLDPAEELGVVCSVLEDFDCATKAFSAACQIDPTQYDNWVSLGDAYLRLQKWAESAAAYEKAVELKPDRTDIWKSLEALYGELKNAARLKEVKAKISELGG